MLKKTIMAAASAAALAGVFAAAQAQVVPLELEGPLSAYEPADEDNGTLTVMGIPVAVDADTAFVTPTADRGEAINSATGLPYTIDEWVRGANFRARRNPGLIDGTVIVTGVWDPSLNDGAGGVYAEEVFSDVSENVILGVVTANNCPNRLCRGAGSGIVVNNGAYFVPNVDARMPAGAPVDGGLFELNLAGADLVGATVGGEGYYSDRPINLPPLMGEEVNENGVHRKQALVYWDFGVADIRPDLLHFKNRREVSVLRIRCNVGDRLEVRGWVHQRVNADGESLDGSAATGSIRATMRFPGTQIANVVRTSTDFVAEPNIAYARYQLRDDVPACAEEVEVEWLINNVPVASIVAPVDRLRGDDGDDD